MKQKIIDGKQVVYCEKCGEEIKSLFHRCNPFKEINKINKVLEEK